jgi:hypothetical protein
VGRPREGADRVLWLAARRRFAEALAVAEQDAGVKAGMRADVGEQYLQYLVDAGQFAAAADLAPRVLRGDGGGGWERWVFAFGQRRALRALAPKLPTSDPRLSAAAYDMTLAALLPSPDGEAEAAAACCPSHPKMRASFYVFSRLADPLFCLPIHDSMQTTPRC